MKKIYFNDYFKIKEETEHLNIPLTEDIEMFIDPYKIVNNRELKVGGSVYYRGKAFLEVLNSLIVQNCSREGIELLNHLSESNGYHLGYSKDNKGKAVGYEKAVNIYNVLANNIFIRQGISVTNEPQNVLLLVKGVGPDNMSDIISNVCKDIFSEFTYQQCLKYNIPMEKFEIEYFDINIRNWSRKTVFLPTYEGKQIILIPKMLSSVSRAYYRMYNRFIAKNYIAIEILNGKRPTDNYDRYVNIFKNGRQQPIIKNVIEDYGKPKEDLVDFVVEYGDKTLLEFQDHIKEEFEI